METSCLPERTNWYKCSRLLIEGGRTILKDFLKKSCSLSSLDQLLASCKSNLTVLRKNNQINSSQWDKLFPHSDIESLDITLLSCIISNCIIQPQSSEKIALDAIRDLRNSLYGHVSHLSMNTDAFMNNWQLISTALTKAQLEFGTNIPLKDFIDTVEKEEIVNGDQWRNELELWKCNDTLQKIQQTVEEHSSEISNHRKKISNMEGEVNRLISTIEQKWSFSSKGSSDSIKKKKRDWRLYKPALDQQGSSDSIKKKTNKQEVNIPALDKQGQTYKKALAKAWVTLVEEMHSDELLHKIIEKELFSQPAIQDLRDERKTSDRNRAILKKISTSGPEKYEVFKECLASIGQNHHVKLLQKYETERAVQD